MQSTPSSAYMYPMSPVPNPALYDSGYSSFNYASPMNASAFHFSSCPYSNEPVYAASQPCKCACLPSMAMLECFLADPAYYGSPAYVYPENPTPCLSSTPMQPSNVCLVEMPQVSVYPSDSSSGQVSDTPSISNSHHWLFNSIRNAYLLCLELTSNTPSTTPTPSSGFSFHAQRE